MQSRVQAGGFLGYLSLFTSLGDALVLRPASAVRLRRAGRDCGFGGVFSTVADHIIPAQELDFCNCWATDRGQFFLRVPGRAQAWRPNSDLSSRPTKCLW